MYAPSLLIDETNDQLVQDAYREVESATILLLIQAIRQNRNESIMHMASHLLTHQATLIASVDGQLLLDALLAAAGPNEIGLLQDLLDCEHLDGFHETIAETLELIHYDIKYVY